MEELPEKNNICTINTGGGSWIGIATGQWNVRGFHPKSEEHPGDRPYLIVEVEPAVGSPKMGIRTVPAGCIKEIETTFTQPKKGDVVNSYYHKGSTILEPTNEGYYISTGTRSYTQIKTPELLAYNPKYYDK